MEVVVGALILSITFGSLLASFVAARKYVARAGRRLTAVNLAKGVVDTIRDEVREDTWDSGNIAVNPNPYPLSTVTIDNVDYQRSYVVDAIDVDGDAINEDFRRVRVTIAFPVVE